MTRSNKSSLDKLINIAVANESGAQNFFSRPTENDWADFDAEPEGQLALDVFEKDGNLVVKSTIAGAKPDDIEISIHNDMLTIRGRREHEEEVNEEDYYSKECYWGSFSRSLILPFAIKNNETKAELKNGVLTITLPKVEEERNTIPIEIIEE